VRAVPAVLPGVRGLSLPALLALVALLAPPASGLATRPRASLTDIENDVMCVVCNEPLAVAQSEEADQERGFIQMLINQGDTKTEIERKLVGQYGEAVLARPPAQGFSLSLYVLPPAVVALGLAILLFTLPRWRARTRARAAQAAADADSSPALSPDESERVEEELTRFGG
jgi:cytochrome c-type biogenesis protein CcmH